MATKPKSDPFLTALANLAALPDVNPAVVQLFAAAAGVEVPASVTPAPEDATGVLLRQIAQTRKGANATPATGRKAPVRKTAARVQREYKVPDKAKRAELASARMLWRLNSEGLVSIRKRASDPILFGTCFDLIGALNSDAS